MPLCGWFRGVGGAAVHADDREFCVRGRSPGVLMNGTPHASTESWRGIMHLYGTGVFVQQGDKKPKSRGQAGTSLRAVAAVMLGLVAGAPSGWAQQPTSSAPD